MLNASKKIQSHFIVRRVAVVLWLRHKTHDREVLGSNPYYGDHFSGTIHLDQSLEQKLWKNSNLALLHVLLSRQWEGGL
jgi:hypothetical protein